MQTGFDFIVPPVDPGDHPVRVNAGGQITATPAELRTAYAGDQSVQAPFASGSHASYTGARAVVECWTARQSELLQVLGNGSPMTRNELATVMQWPLSSVCSVVKALINSQRIEPTGDFDVQEFHGRTTRRERLQLKRSK